MTVNHKTNGSGGFPFNGSQIRGALFDMDGVIADTEAAHRKAWVRYLADEKIQIDLDAFMAECFGMGNREIMARLHPDQAGDPRFLDRKGDEKEEIFLELFRAGEVSPVRGLHAFLDGLRDHGIAIAAGSSAPRKNLETVLEGFAIRDRFSVIVSGSDVRNAKPDPEIFTRCREGLSLPGGVCIVLEDSIVGLRSARAAGCHVIGLATTNPAPVIEPYSDLVVNDFVELGERLFPVGEG